MGLRKVLVDTEEGQIEVSERSFKDYLTLTSKADVTNEDVYKVHIKRPEDWDKLDRLGEKDTHKILLAVKSFKEDDIKK